MMSLLPFICTQIYNPTEAAQPHTAPNYQKVHTYLSNYLPIEFADRFVAMGVDYIKGKFGCVVPFSIGAACGFVHELYHVWWIFVSSLIVSATCF